MHQGTGIGGSIIKQAGSDRPVYLGNPAALEVVQSQRRHSAVERSGNATFSLSGWSLRPMLYCSASPAPCQPPPCPLSSQAAISHYPISFLLLEHRQIMAVVFVALSVSRSVYLVICLARCFALINQFTIHRGLRWLPLAVPNSTARTAAPALA